MLQRGSLSAAVSYDAPSVSGAGGSSSNVASSGAASLTVVGQGGMGVTESSAGAGVGRSACQASVWASSSGVVYKAPGGLLRVTVVIVSAGVLRGSLIVNMPGGSGAVRDGLAILLPVLEHACETIAGPVDHG